MIGRAPVTESQTCFPRLMIVFVTYTRMVRGTHKELVGLDRRRPLERGLLAVGRQLRRRGIRIALFGAVELADLA
jgi:hypothetical protein